MKDPRLAALLSAVFTGLGQIYNGQRVKGIAFSVIQLVFFSLIPLGIGMALAPAFWIFAVYDAYRVADVKLPVTRTGPKAEVQPEPESQEPENLAPGSPKKS